MARHVLIYLPLAIFATLLAPTICAKPDANNLKKLAKFARSKNPAEFEPDMALFQNPPEFHKVLMDENKTLFTEEEKRMILQIHNSYRSMVQPPATDMREMEWDDALEEYATKHTKGCTGNNSESRKIVKKWGPHKSSWETFQNMGEIIYHSSDLNFSLNEALWMFWEKGQYYNIAANTCSKNIDCSSYLIMVNSSNWRVGCGINVCETLKLTNTGPAVFLTCSYNSPYMKNVTKPYKAGNRAADCSKMESYGDNMVARFGLCVTPETLDMKKGFDGNTSIIQLSPSKLTTQLQPPKILKKVATTTTRKAPVTIQLKKITAQKNKPKFDLSHHHDYETHFPAKLFPSKSHNHPKPPPRTHPVSMDSEIPPYRNQSVLRFMRFKAAPGRCWQVRASLVPIASPVFVYAMHAFFSF